jgi:hypothetical protein
VIILGLVQILYKKITKLNLKKNLKLIQINRFRFGFFGQKPVQTGLARFFWFGSDFSVWLDFFGLARF